jgi:hypothetical protein
VNLKILCHWGHSLHQKAIAAMLVSTDYELLRELTPEAWHKHLIGLGQAWVGWLGVAVSKHWPSRKGR